MLGRTKTVAVVLSMLFVISTVSINFNVVLPVLAKNTMHGSAQTYGFIAAMFGLGAFAGAIVAASRKRVSPALLLAAGAGFGAAQLIVATQQSLPCVSLALFATGVCYTIYTASSNAIVQLASPPHMQGRIAGLYNYVFLSSGPLGSLLAGWLCERGAPLAFVAGGGARGRDGARGLCAAAVADAHRNGAPRDGGYGRFRLPSSASQRCSYRCLSARRWTIRRMSVRP